MKTCERCGFENVDIALFCTSCGAPLPVDAPVIEEEVITEEPAEVMDDAAEVMDNAAEVMEETAAAADEAAEAVDEIPEEAVDIEDGLTAEEPAFDAEPETEPAPAPVYEEPAPVYAAPAPAPVYTAPVPEPVYKAPAPEPVPVRTETVKPPKKGEHTVKGRAFGVIAFIINLEALLCCLIPGANFSALIYSFIGLIFCHISKNNTHFRLTKVAKIFGILALIFSIVTILVYCLLAYLAFEALSHDPQVQDFIGRFFY